MSGVIDTLMALKGEMKKSGLVGSTVRTYVFESGIIGFDIIKQVNCTDFLLRVANARPALALESHWQRVADMTMNETIHEPAQGQTQLKRFHRGIVQVIQHCIGKEFVR